MAKRRARGEGSLRKRSDGRWEGRYHRRQKRAFHPLSPAGACDTGGGFLFAPHVAISAASWAAGGWAGEL